jgi:hypothetical protein
MASTAGFANIGYGGVAGILYHHSSDYLDVVCRIKQLNLSMVY